MRSRTFATMRVMGTYRNGVNDASAVDGMGLVVPRERTRGYPERWESSG
jgi:hypothetical protein